MNGMNKMVFKEDDADGYLPAVAELDAAGEFTARRLTGSCQVALAHETGAVVKPDDIGRRFVPQLVVSAGAADFRDVVFPPHAADFAGMRAVTKHRIGRRGVRIRRAC